MIDKLITKLKHIKTKHFIKSNEKVYSSEGKQIKYLYCPYKNSNRLAVIFSAFPGANKTGGYNLVSTLDGVKMNRLYIRDDFGYEKRGSYYLSENGDFYIKRLTTELISKFSQNMDYTVFLGSSKGGWAALYYGLLLGANKVISGAPQYYLGKYLTCKEDHVPILDAMAGDHEKETVSFYDNLIKIIIENRTSLNTKIILHYSKNEPTYESHIKDMIKDLKNNAYNTEEDVETYLTHGEVANYFPKLCLNKLI